MFMRSVRDSWVAVTQQTEFKVEARLRVPGNWSNFLAFMFCILCNIRLLNDLQIESLDDVENEIDESLEKLEKKWKRALLHSVAFY